MEQNVLSVQEALGSILSTRKKYLMEAGLCPAMEGLPRVVTEHLSPKHTKELGEIEGEQKPHLGVGGERH